MSSRGSPKALDNRGIKMPYRKIASSKKTPNQTIKHHRPNTPEHRYLSPAKQRTLGGKRKHRVTKRRRRQAVELHKK